MAKRSGKAANRRARHRHPRRPAVLQPGLGSPTAPVETIAPSASVETEETPRAPAPAPPPRWVSESSGLGERGRAEYHYVVRDLRNIAVLMAVIGALLLAAWAGFSAFDPFGV